MSLIYRYFIKEQIKVFLLFIITFCGLYILVDYSGRFKTFTHYDIGLTQLIPYYLCLMIKRAHILIPFSLMMSCIKTLHKSNTHRELLALLSSGISYQTIFAPFFLVTLSATCFLYINTEFILPKASSIIWDFEDYHFQEENKIQQIPVNSLNLRDETTLIYQSYHPSKKVLRDVFWIRSQDDIYRMKYLYPFFNQPEGYLVDHIKRDKDGNMTKSDSHHLLKLSSMKLPEEDLSKILLPIEDRPISQLILQAPQKFFSFSDLEASLLTHLYYKMTMPLAALLAFLAPAPFCIRFSRNSSYYLIIASSLFGFISFYTLMESSLILGENQALHPLLAISLPYLLFFIPSTLCFCRLFRRKKT